MSGSGILASSLLVVAGALLLVVVVLVHARDVTTTLEYRGDEPLPATGTDTPHKPHTVAGMRDHRQGRMSLHAEVPSSKVKREQALRNILAARRRQILSQRPIELSASPTSPTSPTSRTLRSDGSSTWRDGSDMLEAQETRHAMYVTASGSTRASMEEETSEVLTAAEEKSGSKPTGVVEEPALKEADSGGGGDGRQVAEQESRRKASDENSTSSSSAESKPASGNSRSNYSIGHRNSSGVAAHSSPTSSSPVGPKAGESESRRKNTVPMPESLYNYFRPVESNIPVEDMSQFLYFGQKIQPESQNSTNNNTLEVTPTAPPLPSSRRRYSIKRFSTTTPVPVPKLEDIINEEMNIAVERQTVEKNKVPKLKSGFRSPDSGIYYRKPRPAEVTLASNVIAGLEGGGSTPSSPLADKFLQDDNPSAHAATRQQLQNASERGSGAAHVPPQTRNATNSTQIPHQQPVSANMREESTTESEISLKDHPTDTANKAPPTSNGVAAAKLSKKGPRRRKIDNLALDPDAASVTTSSRENLDKESSSTVIPETSDAGEHAPTDTEMRGYPDQKVRRADDFEVNDPAQLSNNDEEQMQMDQSHSLGARENNNIETSTLREKPSRSTSGSQYPMAWMSLAGRAETSTLRIIVTEENYSGSSPIPSDPIERNTVKPVDSTLERVRSPASGHAITAKSPEAPSAGIRIDLGSGRRNRSGESQGQQQNHQQQQQQQHVYAYTITNVTRLLRNYTGPGLSIEELGGGPQRSSGAAEITTGSPDRPEASPSPPPPPASSSPLLPRAGSGIEASRAPAELSAGTTVEPARAGGAFTADSSSQVGERPRKVAAVAQQQRAPASRGTSPGHLSVNKSTGSRGPRPAELTTRGTVRWNHTKSRASEVENFGDRRLLRKSASAVLNQRIGAASSDEDLTFTKRRRVPNGQSAPSIGGRRLKGPGLSKTPEEAAMGTTNRPVGFNQSTANSEKKADTADQKVEATVRLPQEAALAAARQGLETAVTKSETLDDTAIEQAPNATSFSGSGEVALESTSTRLGSDMIEADSNQSVALSSQDLQNNTKDQSVVAANENDARLAPNVNEISSSSALGTSTNNPSGSSTVTVTNAENLGAKETTTPSSTVTASTPVFPVTPETHAEAGRVSIEKETFTLKPTEPESQVTGTKTTEASGALGAVVHLEPAEIQRMYRSKNVTTTTAPTPSSPRTAENGASGSQDPGIPGDLIKLQEKIASGGNPRKRVSSERSPEVRARNLSDKSKDKDDVLPIMQLYNTSNMFNASGTEDAFSRGTERSPAELPVNVEGEKQREASRTEKSNGAETWSRSAGNVPVNPARAPPRKEGPSSGTQTSSRRDKSEVNRETSSHVAPTGPGRGSSFVNASAANRTRHRPVFNPSVLPEYNGSLYPVDLNRTFFESGLISVSPSEAVNISEGISKRPNSDAVATQETVAVVSYILATLVVFPIAVGVGLILRRLILRNRKVLEESDTSSEISCRKDALNLENGDFKTSIEKAITKLPRIQHLCLEAEKPPPPSTPKSRWEFPRDKLRLQTVLGQGNFGQVWKAEADDLTGHQGTTRLVAVKTVKEGASEREKEDLVQELEIMQQLGSHPNVVTLLGCCTEQEPHYLILEYVMYGKLLAYLRDHRTRQDFYNFSEDSAALTSRDLTVFGYCVARGMEYLASKKIIHRDLAARNVLVDHNKLCKIADFGMSLFANEDGEVIETRHGRNALPIRWMAPESLIYSLFTTKTDVWSFGILMWEIVTLGSTPYPDMTAREVMRNVQNGYRLERPSHCRSELFRVISRCWHADPDRRPEFQTLRRDMAQLLEDNKNGHYVDLESFASECTD